MSAPFLPSYLVHTSKGFFFQIRVPKPLQHIFKRKMLRKAIHATDKLLATRQAIVYAAKVLEIFDSLQGIPMAKLPFINDSKIIIKRSGVVTSADGTVSQIVDEFHLDPAHRAEELQDLIDKGVIFRASELGNPKISTSPLPVPVKPDSAAVTEDGNCLLLSTAILEYFHAMVQTEERWRENYIPEQRTLFDLLIEALGDRDIRSITRDNARQVFEVMKQLPANRNKDKTLKGRTLTQLLEIKKVRKISTTTINLNMSKISAFFSWLEREDKIDKNPFTRLQIADKTPTRAKRKIFDTSDLKLIFSHPYFSKHAFNHPHEFWISLLGLFTGARAGELAQLHKADIKDIDGIWYLDLINEDDGEEQKLNSSKKVLKTDSSRRNIPLHSALIKLGFLDFVKKAKSGRLFPMLHERSGR